MLQCTPPTGHVTFNFHFLRVNKEKNVYTVIMKQSYVFVLDNCEITVDKKNNTLNPTLKRFTQTEKVKKCYVVPHSPLCFSLYIFLFPHLIKVKSKSKSALLSILPHVPYIHTEN